MSDPLGTVRGVAENAVSVRTVLDRDGGPQLSPSRELTLDQVRRVTLHAQGFLGADGRRGGVAGVLRRVAAVQLDTISVLARSHELVAYARLGPVGRESVEKAFWPAKKPTTFEYWAHAACVLPL